MNLIRLNLIEHCFHNPAFLKQAPFTYSRTVVLITYKMDVGNLFTSVDLDDYLILRIIAG